MEAHPLRVLRVVEETHDTRSFVFAVPAGLADAFRYEAGQFLTFRVPLGETPLMRCYSLSSAPGIDAEHQVTVKRVDDGRVSNWFNDQVKEGDTVEVMAPTGRFVLRAAEAPLLFLGGGSGITPILSIVKTALATTPRRMRLVYANRDAESVIFRETLTKLADGSGGRLELIHHLDAEQGFMEPAALEARLAGFEDAHAYVCGPGPFMDLVESALAKRGFDKSRIFIERFASPPDGEIPEVVLSVDGADAEVPTTLIVHLDGERHEVPYEKGKSILRTVIDAGLRPPFACEEGYCGSCAAIRVEGEVTMATNDVFDESEVAEGHILTCQGHPSSGVCEVRYED